MVIQKKTQNHNQNGRPDKKHFGSTQELAFLVRRGRECIVVSHKVVKIGPDDVHAKPEVVREGRVRERVDDALVANAPLCLN